MDFYVMEPEEINKKVEYREEKILKPYLTSVNFLNFKDYLKSPEYNDPRLKSMISASLHQSPVATPVFNDSKGNIKL